MTPKKYPQNLHTKKILIFLKTPKNIEIQNFEPPKNDQSLRMYENIKSPPPLGTCIHVPSGKPDWPHSDRKVAKSG